MGYYGSVTPVSTKRMKRMKSIRLANPASFGARQSCFINWNRSGNLLKDELESFFCVEFLSKSTNTGHGKLLQVHHILHSN